MEDDIALTIGRELIAHANAQGVPIVFSNVVAPWDRTDKPDPSPKEYLRQQTFSGPPDVYGIECGESEYAWLIQVSAYVRDGLGETRPRRQMDALRSAFPYLHEFIGAEHRYQVREPLTVAQPVPIPGWLSIPGTFRVHTFA